MASLIKPTAPTKRPVPGPPPRLTEASPALELEVVLVDAAQAAEWLESNNNNRRIRKSRLVEFRRDMLAGNWREIGDPIRFDTHGTLIDGQHRLEAIVLAATTQPDIQIPLVVARGVRPEDHVVIDTGTRRTAGDQLRIAGYSNFAILAVAAKWCILYDRKVIQSGPVEAMVKTVTHTEIMEYVEKNPDLQNIAAEVGGGLGRKCDMPNGHIAAGWYLCWRINGSEADDFFGRFADGIGLFDGDPILALRSRLREISRNRASLSADMYMSLLFRTWNARREDRTMKIIPLERQGKPIPIPNLV
jgi:hypothetical protein